MKEVSVGLSAPERATHESGLGGGEFDERERLLRLLKAIVEANGSGNFEKARALEEYLKDYPPELIKSIRVSIGDGSEESEALL